jgi:hypothetical protein
MVCSQLVSSQAFETANGIGIGMLSPSVSADFLPALPSSDSLLWSPSLKPEMAPTQKDDQFAPLLSPSSTDDEISIGRHLRMYPYSLAYELISNIGLKPIFQQSHYLSIKRLKVLTLDLAPLNFRICRLEASTHLPFT